MINYFFFFLFVRLLLSFIFFPPASELDIIAEELYYRRLL